MARGRKPGASGQARKAGSGAAGGGKAVPELEDYRHPEATRKNNPPAALASAAQVPAIPKAKYEYNPHLPPVLRFDETGEADRLPELLAEAGKRKLTAEELEVLGAALRREEPWLEWSGKREAKSFTVDPVALHIHERVSAQAILKIAARQDVERTLFGDPQQAYQDAVQFYKHDVDWSNRLILGDSLQVMSSLAKREDLAGKVQMIYFDPPYGIKFGSNFQPEVGKRDVKDKQEDLTREAEMVKAYRDTWSLGIHSYLSYLRDRLIAARELLADTGSIFVQISDENLHRVRHLMDEVFGSNNFVSVIAFKKTSGLGTFGVGSVLDYIIWFGKKRESTVVNEIKEMKVPGDQIGIFYDHIRTNDGELRRISTDEKQLLTEATIESVFQGSVLYSEGATAKGSFEIKIGSERFTPPHNAHWKTSLDGYVQAFES